MTSRRIATAPGIELAVIDAGPTDGPGHWTQQEAPQEFNRALHDALQGAACTSSADGQIDSERTTDNGRQHGRFHPRPTILPDGGQWSSRLYAHHSKGFR